MINTLITTYWAKGICPISHQLAKQLRKEFNNLDYKDITDKPLLDKVIRLVHAKPKDAYQAKLFKFICS